MRFLLSVERRTERQGIERGGNPAFGVPLARRRIDPEEPASGMTTMPQSVQVRC